jgi:hypothetical protein
MNYLVVPLPEAIEVRAGDVVEVAFQYTFGGPLHTLAPTARLR